MLTEKKMFVNFKKFLILLLLGIQTKIAALLELDHSNTHTTRPLTSGIELFLLEICISLVYDTQ